MTFCCKNYREPDHCCGKLGGECVPGRKGCVLDGQFKLSPALADKITDINAEAVAQPDKR